ncbi:uncharacterized protein [Panulirus ornatus]|uniref:uncharacterized protein n=1 Tax=Panulirus ornatus TaxID=150431 RepID=UPI003A83FD3D
MRETQKAATLLVAGAALLLLTYQVLLRRVNSVKNQENQILLNSVTSSLSRPRTLRTEYKVWPAFSTKGKHSKEWYAENCFDGTDMKELEEVFLKWIPKWSKSAVPDCADLYHEFDQLYEVHHRYTPRLIFPPKHAERVRKWLRGDKELLEAVHHQTVLHVFQPLTGEHSLYNTVRTKRPRPLVPVNLHEWVDRQANDSLPTCDFCNFRNMTATDALGRHETSKTMRVSNTFKVERWHSLVVTRHQHHPLNFSLDTFVAFLDEANAYIKQIARTEEEYMYPNLAWDSLYQAGVSVLHPHIHIMITPDHYYGFYELLRSSGQRYFDATGRNYFATLLEIHTALGLTIKYGNAVAFPTIAGKADMEIMFLSEEPGEDFYRLIFYTVEAYHDTYTQLCKGFSASYPPQGDSEAARVGRIPVIARLISRGDCTSPRTDYTTYEIFQIVERYHDPWDVARAIRRSIEKHDKA